jgi:hypothetical protein
MPAENFIAMTTVASRNLVAIHSAQGELSVRIDIGLPYQCSDNEWACPIALEGLYNKLPDVHGEDSFQALMLAQNLARTLLNDFVEKGGQLLDAPGGVSVNVERLFSSGVMS